MRKFVSLIVCLFFVGALATSLACKKEEKIPSPEEKAISWMTKVETRNMVAMSDETYQEEGIGEQQEETITPEEEEEPSREEEYEEEQGEEPYPDEPSSEELDES